MDKKMAQCLCHMQTFKTSRTETRSWRAWNSI
jgi:hypothetical protein